MYLYNAYVYVQCICICTIYMYMYNVYVPLLLAHVKSDSNTCECECVVRLWYASFVPILIGVLCMIVLINVYVIRLRDSNWSCLYICSSFLLLGG